MITGKVEARDLKPEDVLVIVAWDKVLGTVVDVVPETDYDNSRHVMVEYRTDRGGTGYVRFGRRDMVDIKA
jgi:hypothetical protein